MSKARELAELSRTVSDSADATAITINSSEEVTFADDIFLGDDKQLVLGNSSDFTLKHHNSGYGHVQNTGTLYIDAETIDLRTDNSSIGSALTLAANNNATFSGSVTAAGVTVGNSNLGSNSSHLANITLNNNGYIGSANASTALQIQTSGNAVFSGSVNTSSYLYANSSSSGDYIRIYSGSGTGKWDIYQNGANLRFSDNESAGAVHIDTNVGIGAAPVDSSSFGRALDVSSNTGAGLYLRDAGDSTYGAIGMFNSSLSINAKASAGKIVFYSNNSPKAEIGSDGNMLIGTQQTGGVRLNAETNLNGNLAGQFRNTHATGSYGIKVMGGHDNSNYSAVFTDKDNTTLMMIRGNGNVGVGTDSIATNTKLHVKAGTNINFEVENSSSTLRLSALNDARSANVPMQFASSSFQFLTGNVGIGTSSAGTFRTKIKHSAASVTTGLGIEASANDSVLRVFHSGSLAGFNATYSSTGAYVPMVFNVGSGGEAMRIDTSGDLILAANATGAALIKGVSGDQTDRNSGGYPQFTFVGNEGTGIRRPSANVLAFDTSGDEAMRIDSSGRLLVAKSSAAFGTVGHEFDALGQIASTADGRSVVYLNRLSSDGKILQFHKDGTEVGSIGVVNQNNLYIHGDTVGIGIGDDNLYPTNSSGTGTSGALDLGDPAAKFKDLYLSGGVVFGAASGTVTDQTFDTYEEGNFSPTITGETGAFTTSGQDTTGKYVRIGNWVHLEMDGYITTPTGGSGTLRLTGLPFSMPAGRSAVGSMTAGRWDNSVSGDGWAPFIAAGTNYLQFRAAEAYSGSGDGIETASTATISGNTTPFWGITISFRVS